MIETVNKSGFIMYCDYREFFETLEPEQVKAIMLAIFDYERDGTVADLDPVTRMAFVAIRQSLDRNRRKHEEISKKRREAGRAGRAIVSKCQQMPASASDTEKDTEKDTETENETETPPKPPSGGRVGADDKLPTEPGTPNPVNGPDPDDLSDSDVTDVAAQFAEAYRAIRGRPLPHMQADYDARAFTMRAMREGVTRATMEDALAWLVPNHGGPGVPRIRKPNELTADWFDAILDARTRAERREEENGGDLL